MFKQHLVPSGPGAVFLSLLYLYIASISFALIPGVPQKSTMRISGSFPKANSPGR